MIGEGVQNKADGSVQGEHSERSEWGRPGRVGPPVDLTTSHIWGKGALPRPLSLPPAKLTAWKGGNLLSLKGWRPPRETKHWRPRGKAGPFTGPTRLRLKRKIATVRADRKPNIIHLTFSDENLPDSPDEARLRLRRLFDRLQYLFLGNVGMVWRMGWETRKSGAFIGRAVPHFHTLVWVNGGDVDIPREVVRRAWARANHHPSEWAEAKHESHGCRVDRARSLRRAAGYMAKAYIAKGEPEPGPYHAGRRWGVMGKERIPWAEAVEWVVSWATFHDVRRGVARAARQSLKGAYPLDGRTVFVRSPEAYSRLAGGP